MKNSVAKMSSLVVVAFVLLSLLGIGCSLNTDSGPSAIEFVSAVQTGGTLGVDDSTGLTLTFDVDPTTLTVDDILLTGATKGELSGTGVTRSLAISAITVANGETVAVVIESPDGYEISGSPQTAEVYKSLRIGNIGPVGGYVFYVNPNWETDGWRYLEAAPYGWYDEGADPSFEWGAYGYIVSPSATAIDVGTGEDNTANIVSYHNGLEAAYPEKGEYYTNGAEYFTGNDGTVAAKVCLEYSVTVGSTTYDEWFLPSKVELDLMYDNLKVNSLGSFSSNNYWSSTENSEYNGSLQSFNDGVQFIGNKGYTYKVRPVRSF